MPQNNIIEFFFLMLFYNKSCILFMFGNIKKLQIKHTILVNVIAMLKVPACFPIFY